MADEGRKPDGAGAHKNKYEDREQGGSIYLHLIRHTGVGSHVKRQSMVQDMYRCIRDGLPDGAGGLFCRC